MPQGVMKTHLVKRGDVVSAWYLVDADGQVLGRMATRISRILQGKNKPIYTPHIDTGDHVVVINAEKVLLTGKKSEQKKYHKYTGYMSGYREIGIQDLQKKKPERVIEYAVRRMLPKTTMGHQMLKKLKVYAGAEHPHSGQKPIPLSLSRTGPAGR